MADQKKWFKVWASLLTDASFQNIRLEDMGRWTLLGAMICQQGERGKLRIIPPAELILMMFRSSSLEDLKICLKRLPNVHIEEVKNDNGDFTVIMRNWFKYQVDSTSYERLKRSRCKRRGEEIREDKKRGEEKSLPLFVSEWQKKTAQEKQAGAAQISEGLKAFNLGFRQQDDLYKKIMGEEKHGTIRGKSISEQVAERRAKERSEEIRKESSAGQVLARLRDLPKVPPEA